MTKAEQTKRWIKATLANDEVSTNEEMVAYFVENGLSQKVAESWVALRGDYLRNLICDLEP